MFEDDADRFWGQKIRPKKGAEKAPNSSKITGLFEGEISALLWIRIWVTDDDVVEYFDFEDASGVA